MSSTGRSSGTVLTLLLVRVSVDRLCDKHRYPMARLCLGRVTRKPAFVVCDIVKLKPDCLASETSRNIEILRIASGIIKLSRKRTTKALLSLRGCAGWSAPLLSTCSKVCLSRDTSHFIVLFHARQLIIMTIHVYDTKN